MTKSSYSKSLIFLFTLLVFTAFAYAQTTTVWIVRHAEKDTTQAGSDPDLSPLGQQRAKDLITYVKLNQPIAVFATPYKRTQQTVQGFGIPVTPYQPVEFKQLVSTITDKYAGKTVLIAGHSNTVLETIEAFGGIRPVQKLTDDDYDYIFKVTIANGKVKTTMKHYGAMHHNDKGGTMMMQSQ